MYKTIKPLMSVVFLGALYIGLVSNVASAITWTDTVGVTAGSDFITKSASSAWGNGGAASQETFAGDGGVSFTAYQRNTFRMVGLSSSNADADYTSIGYTIYLRGQEVHVYESGNPKGAYGTYQSVDSFSVERVGSTIVYKKNGVVFYTSLTTTTAVLLADFAIHTRGGAIRDVSIFTNTNSNRNSLDAADGSQINAVYVDYEGDVGIGTINPGIHKLAVNGTIKAREVIVETSGWPDFVFSKHYNLVPLVQLEKYIESNKHLPQIPSADEAVENGIGVGNMQAKLLQKIEELTLYMIKLKKKTEEFEKEDLVLRDENALLRSENELIKKRLEVLERGKM